MKKIIFVLVMVLVLLPVKITFASEVPNFPSCESKLDETGDLAHYDTGLHQIAGGGLLEGKDDVFSLQNGNAVQCFCSPVGSGTQTNWLKSEVSVNGWLDIGNGLQWNLEDENYVVLNSSYECHPQPTPTPSPTPPSGSGGGGCCPLPPVQVIVPTPTPMPPSVQPTPTPTPLFTELIRTGNPNGELPRTGIPIWLIWVVIIGLGIILLTIK